MDIKYVVFSAGAIGGIGHIGAWRAIEESQIAIKGMSGCSMGSIMALLTSIGYRSNELEIIAKCFKYKDYTDIQLNLIYRRFGLETGRKLMKLLSKLIKWKTMSDGLTFIDHWRLTGRQLWINAACLEKQRCKYYSVWTSPNMVITEAIRRSIAIPYLFASVKTKRHTFIDGGCYDPLPVKMFHPEKTICINIRNTSTLIPTKINLLSFSSILLNSMFTELNIFRFKSQELQGYKIIYIYTGLESVKLDLTLNQIDNIIKQGYIVVKDALKDISF